MADPTTEVCDLEPFNAEVVPSGMDTRDNARTIQILARQLEGYLTRLKDAVCNDLASIHEECCGGAGGGASEFVDLDDTPSVYTGEADKVVKVNAGETALEFITLSGVGILDYSIAEQDTGILWTDLRTIFQKTITFGTLPNNTTKSVAHGVSGVEDWIDYKWMARRVSDGSTLPMPNVSDTALGSQCQMSVDNTNVIAKTTSNLSAFIGNMTLYYTKT